MLKLTVPCDRVGFDPPPADVTIKVLALEDRWRLFVWTTNGGSDRMGSWVADHAQGALRRRIRERLSVYDLPELPRAWSWWQASFDVLAAQLSHAGQADLVLRGSEDTLRSFTAGLGSTGELGPVQEISSGLLTQRQHETLAMALSEGYFEVPREIRLADLAEKIGTSIGSLSELLRRAEANILETYLEATPAPGLQGSDV